MKRTLLTCLLLAFGVSCSNSQNKTQFSIAGTIKGLTGGTAYLEELTFTGRYPVDTSLISAQGTFEFKPTIRNSGLYQIKFNEQAAVLLNLDGQPARITLHGDTAQLRNFTYQIKGSPPSEQLRQLIHTQKQLSESVNRAVQSFQGLPAEGATETMRMQAMRSIEQADSAFRHFHRNYADTVRNHVLALFAISNLDPNNEKAAFERLEKRLREAMDQSPLSQSFLTMMANQRQTRQADPYAPKFKVGDEVPDIEMADVNGNIIRLSSLRGKVVLLDFWAAWCGPCRMENPNIVRAYEQYKNKGFTVFSVSLDTDRSRWLAAIEKDKLSWPYHVSQLKGWQSPICQEYNIRSIPASYLLDRSGRVIAVNPRGNALEDALSKVLN